MPDAPDGYDVPTSSNRNAVGDLGEIAARLGSPSFFDRAGSVVYYDDASTAKLLNEHSIPTAPATLKVVDHHTYRHPYAYELATTPATWGTSFIQDYTGALDANSIGIEWLIKTEGNCSTVGFGLDYKTSDFWLALDTKFNQVAGTVWLQGFSGGIVTFAGDDDLSKGSQVYCVVKQVFDIPTAKLKRFMINNYKYDLTGYDLDLSGSGAYNNLNWYFNAGSTLVNTTSYFQSVVITVGEP